MNKIVYNNLQEIRLPEEVPLSEFLDKKLVEPMDDLAHATLNNVKAFIFIIFWQPW